MKPHTLLPTIALLSLSTGHHGRQCHAWAPTAFFNPEVASSNRNIIRAGRQTTRISSIRRPPRVGGVACSLSQNANEEEEGDDTFFFRASQLAAQQRMQRLKDGLDPFAISLSSTADAADDDAADGGDVDDEVKTITKGVGGPPEEEMQSSSSPQPPSSPPNIVENTVVETPAEQKEMITKSSQSSYTFQRKLLETRLAMDERAKLTSHNDIDIAVEESEETSIANTERIEDADADETTLGEIDANALDEILSSAPGASDIGEGDGEEDAVAVAVVLTEKSESEGRVGDGASNARDTPSSNSSEGRGTTPTTPATEAERPQSVERPVAASDDEDDDDDDDYDAPPSSLSSDGKELFEPDPDSTNNNVDPQNVEMGLFVLTRSLMALKSIVSKE